MRLWKPQTRSEFKQIEFSPPLLLTVGNLFPFRSVKKEFYLLYTLYLSIFKHATRGVPSPSKLVQIQKNNVSLFERCSNVILLPFEQIFARGYIFRCFCAEERNEISCALLGSWRNPLKCTGKGYFLKLNTIGSNVSFLQIINIFCVNFVVNLVPSIRSPGHIRPL